MKCAHPLVTFYNGFALMNIFPPLILTALQAVGWQKFISESVLLHEQKMQFWRH